PHGCYLIRFESLLATLEPDQITRGGSTGEWSVKDALAHNAWYRREEAELFGETGVEASPLWEVPQDPRSEMLFEQNRAQSLDQTLAEFRQAFDKLIAAVERLTGGELNTPDRFPGTSVDRPP
ncbi:MAG TPA: hypothetical protein EYN37_00340, partial [Dehalococcoidia bacterium]|nr:hypothetical protein [Dehalococcoidia bacterium]